MPVFNKLTVVASPNYNYLRQEGYVIVIVCLSVCWQLCAKTSERICMKFSGKVGNGPVNEWSKFGGDLDHRHVP